MSQKRPTFDFKWIEHTSQFNEDVEKSGERYILEVGVQLYELHGDLPFLPGRKKFEKVKKAVAKLHDKTGYVIHLRKLKQTLNHGLTLEKFTGSLVLI